MLNKGKLARDISYLLGLPIWRGHGKANEIVTTIIETIIACLQRGEPVDIAGFGSFRVIDDKKGYRLQAHMYDGSKWTASTTKTMEPKPLRKKVIFKPSKALTKYIRNGNQ